MSRNDTVRAIDLYAGIGGWSLGLKLAGAEIVESYEWWQPAIDTHNANHGGNLKPVDIRKLSLDQLPSDIEIVVGSPPCTEFSYANRGGSGDLAEGLKDLVKFFEVVDHLKPRFWAMENVPRVAEFLRAGFKTKGHALYRFRHLNAQIDVFDFSEYGTPQARKRCIATNVPLDFIRALQPATGRRTLGDVISALAADNAVTDPVWGKQLPPKDISDMQVETCLNSEELRMNREAKEHHPVYNNMAFPDPFDRPARTVTATCTRVSRESIIIADPRKPDCVRRLNIRERACLQGFPITYQFIARSFAEKAKMIGNAIPPTFTYLLGSIMVGKGSTALPYSTVGEGLELPSIRSTETAADTEGRTYPKGRAFRAALHGFRFKSGMRLDLSNRQAGNETIWAVRFYFGPSKDVKQIELDGSVTRELRKSPALSSILNDCQGAFMRARSLIAQTTPGDVQLAWTHRAGGMGPYELTDCLGGLAEEVHARLASDLDEEEQAAVARYVVAAASGDLEGEKVPGRGKLERNATRILAGLIVGDWFNSLGWHETRRAAA